MKNRRLFWCLWLLLSGCTGLSKTELNSAVAAADELETVLALYAYEDRLRQVKDPAWIQERLARMQKDESALQGCQDLWETLESALLIGVSETERGQSRALLESCLETNPGPLLTGYIRARLDTLDRTERLQKELRSVQQTLERQREELARLRNRIKTLTAKNREFLALRSRMKVLENQNRTLKQQIEALTNIEQNLMNRKLEQ